MTLGETEKSYRYLKIILQNSVITGNCHLIQIKTVGQEFQKQLSWMALAQSVQEFSFRWKKFADLNGAEISLQGGSLTMLGSWCWLLGDLLPCHLKFSVGLLNPQKWWLASPKVSKLLWPSLGQCTPRFPLILQAKEINLIQWRWRIHKGMDTKRWRSLKASGSLVVGPSKSDPASTKWRW